ncbi:MAG TPA: cytochrome c [Candidatus Acidoferrales bacterium]|nr:cytochrome c [Candidatus Acidoferrales bacterium]
MRKLRMPPSRSFAAGFLRLRSILIAAFCGMLLATGCRQDMQVQPRYNPYDASHFFDDGRSVRQPVPGTVARGHLHLDELLYTGKINGKEADVFPFPITRTDLNRGRERYDIYCSPCHDYTGSGRGMIVLRGFPQPPSFHMDRLRQAPAGHFVDVITNGLGVMYPYGDRVSPEDRWRIAAYIRALQLSQQGSTSDVPESARAQLQSQQTKSPGAPR